MKTFVSLLLLLSALLVAIPSAMADSEPPCEVTWRQVYLDMDHATNVPSGVECESCEVTYREYYFDMDHPTYVPDGVACA